MTRRRACRQCLALGLLASALIHGVAVRLWLGAEPAPRPPPPVLAIELDLAAFTEGSGADHGAANGSGADLAKVADPPRPAEPSPPPATPKLTSSPPSAPAPRDSSKPVRPVKVEPKSVQELRQLMPPAEKPLPRPEAKPVSRPRSEPKPELKPELRPAPVPTPRPQPPQPPRPQAGKPAAIDRPAPARPAREGAAARPPVQATPTDDAFGLGFGAARQPASDGTGASVAAARPKDGAGPNAAPKTPTAASKAAAEGAYLAELQRAIGRLQRFPDEARQRRKTGVAIVAFVIDANGQIGQIRIAQSAGDPDLDRAALETLKRLGRFKPIPAVIARTSWPMRVPIRFNLR